MAGGGDERLELKFRLYDGSDIGPGKYAPSTTIATLKERIVAEWPQGYSWNCAPYSLELLNRKVSSGLPWPPYIMERASEPSPKAGCPLNFTGSHKINGTDKKTIPKTVNDVKLIYSGRFLENNKTLAESRLLLDGLPGGIITMHVVVQPSLARKKADKNADEMPKKNLCSCTII